ncbi:hypothetical protein CC1G_11930 [Coprinopsis cinerea okayama7|uniref:AT hook domain-containing protein n=1 Tax=Coprinopsis cinerea (strain Okayama-7 / 130 / ATCC MYA-4618 / FGSC 9003) TaxID=240176 RepID=A8NFR9_COPC7|nr:hypothetical protein CC1G_11930 [Coprinopsis cinerea okayama7\|eukprot:XP_001833353.1 hypothetical protein CC1G_11930 [Coprinopsis cinerea okayama7\
MSSSPPPRDVLDDAERSPLEDELAASPPRNSTEPEAGTSAVPVKRGRGRPKGSKNKKTLGSPATPTTPTVPRKRGRPPKEKKDDEEPRPKRPRGRPPKNPKPEGSTAAPAASASGDGAPVKRKRGRPPKNPPASTT